MVDKLFSYTVSKAANTTAFENACDSIESSVDDIKIESLLEDVDGTMIQIYGIPTGRIKVVNDYEVDAVYIDSDIELNILI